MKNTFSPCHALQALGERNWFIYGFISTAMKPIISTEKQWNVEHYYECYRLGFLNSLYFLTQYYFNLLFSGRLLEKRVTLCLSAYLSELDERLDPAKTGRKRVPLLSSGAFNRKGKETVHCFFTFTETQGQWCFPSSLLLTQTYC